MQSVTNNVRDYIKDRGITVTRIAEATGVNYQKLCRSFDDNFARELNADEFLKVCRFLEVDPFAFMKSA